MTNYAIKGTYVDENGFNDGRGTLRITLTTDGTIADDMETLRCEQWGGDVPIITNGCWQFWPDESELARVGIAPKQMISKD